jgi:hypothetical protein
VVVKAHFGRAITGPFGTEERFDVIGNAVNVAATLPARAVAVSAEAFRLLGSAGRRAFKKHTALWHRLLRWPASESGRLRHGDRPQGARGRRAIMLPILPPPRRVGAGALRPRRAEVNRRRQVPGSRVMRAPSARRRSSMRS